MKIQAELQKQIDKFNSIIEFLDGQSRSLAHPEFGPDGWHHWNYDLGQMKGFLQDERQLVIDELRRFNAFLESTEYEELHVWDSWRGTPEAAEYGYHPSPSRKLNLMESDLVETEEEAKLNH